MNAGMRKNRDVRWLLGFGLEQQRSIKIFIEFKEGLEGNGCQGRLRR